MRHLWWLGALLCAVAPDLPAEERDMLFESARTRGRGQTFVAAFDSNEAAYLNPATLGETKITFQYRPIRLDAFVGKNSISTISEIVQISDADDGFAFLKKFDDKFGERQYGRLQMFPLGLRLGGLDLSLFAATNNWLELRNPALPNASFSSDSYYGLAASYGRAFGKSWSAGITVRPMTRYYIAGEIQFANLLDFLPPSQTDFEDYAKLKKGNGVGVDLGLVWMPTKNFRWGLTVQNVGDVGFGEEEDSPPPIKQSINTGMLYRIAMGRWDLDLSADLQNIENREGVNFLRTLHTGAEFGYAMFTRDHDLGVTAGLSEGYVVAGLFADIWVLRLDISHYTAELEQAPGQRPDHRYAMSLQTSMTF